MSKARQAVAALAMVLCAKTATAQFVQQGGKLVGLNAPGDAHQGTSVAISADGTTAIVGGAGDNTWAGAAWVYTRSGPVWLQQGLKLVGTGAVGAAEQGYSVAVSADGNTALVGGPRDNSNTGAAWVFTRSGGVWSQQGLKLVGSNAIGGAYQGWSVSLSADGNTAIVGGPFDNANAGATWVFTRSGDTWTQQGEKLVGSGAVGAAWQGNSVSLSADGATAIVGGPGDDPDPDPPHYGSGAAWVFTRSGVNWTQVGSKLVGSGAAGRAHQGSSVAISGDGSTAIIGGADDDSHMGAAWVFTNSGGVWSQQGSKLVGTGALGAVVLQGVSVALSTDGSTALVGGLDDDSTVGALWVYTRSGVAWSQQGSKLVGTDAAANRLLGWSVALSGDGNTALAGGIGDNAYIGAAWVFTRSGGVWSQMGSKLVGGVPAGAGLQGVSVAVSADGSTALVGAVWDASHTGAAWVYARSGGVWSQQGFKLVGTGAVGAAYQGCSVALSADGNTALVGGSMDASNTGAVWVFTRSGGVWSQQGSKLTGTGAVGAARQGNAVALSADGNTAFVGGFSDDSWIGAAWVFTRSGGVWSQQGDKLVGTGAVPYDPGDGSTEVLQGHSVALSGDGNTAVVGGDGDDDQNGAMWVFTRGGGVWSQQGSKLVGTGAVGVALQGQSVALSADGNTALSGGMADDSMAGATWVFTRSGGVWSQQGSKLVGTGAVGAAFQSYSVALSSDGNTAIASGPADDSWAGATWVFTRAAGVWSQHGSKLVGTGAVGDAGQGNGVAISADGTTVMAGGPYDNSNAGAAWVFVSPATQLAFVQQPSTTLAGQTIAPAVTVQLQDSGGAPVAEAGKTITLSLSSGTGTLGGTLSRVTNAAGVATFDDLSVDLTGSKQLTAANTGRTSAVSSAFTITTPPAPGVTTIAPNSGPTAGGTGVTITGTNFVNGATVAIGGVAATGVVVGSATSITATTDTHAAGLVDVVVTNPDAQAGTLSNGFTYLAPPGVTTIVPDTGPTAGGTSVTITGTNFVTGATVAIGGVAATGVSVDSATSITATTGAHAAGLVDVVVTNPDTQTGTLSNGFSYVTLQLAFIQQATTTTAGQQIAPAVTVQLEDSGGASQAEAGVTVTMSLSSGTGTLGGTLSRLTDASGLATFDDLSIDLSGSKQLTAASPGRAAAVSNAFTITAAAPASIAAIRGTSQCVRVGCACPEPLEVRVTDAFGNPVSGALVTYTAPSSGPSATLSNGGSATTNATGCASVTATVNDIPGGPYLVTAATGTLPEVTFALDNVLEVPALSGLGLLGLALLVLAAGGISLRRP